MRILYFEPDAGLNEIFAERLEIRGHTVIACTTPEQALAKLEDGMSYDVAILEESYMPEDTEGIAIARRFRELFPQAHIIGYSDPLKWPGWDDFRDDKKFAYINKDPMSSSRVFQLLLQLEAKLAPAA